MMEKQSPPRLAQRILLRVLRDDLKEEVIGDLEEKYQTTRRTSSTFRAKINYWYQVIHYMRPFAIRNLTSPYINQRDMFRSYFKVGFRNLFRNKGYSALNIGGLAVGMAVAITIGLWVHDELSFDDYHKNKGQIARVMRNGTLNGETGTTNYLPYPLADELRSLYGEKFKHILNAWPLADHTLSAGDKKITKAGTFIDSGAPEMLTLEMVAGDWSTLKDTHGIILSTSLVSALFGDQEPLGKLIRIDDKMDVTVTGIYKDLPDNTHFAGANFFASWDLFVTENQWMTTQGFKNNFLDVYVELAPGHNLEATSEQICDIILNNVRDDKTYVAVNPQLFLHPMSKWHLYSEWRNGVNVGGRIQFVLLFGVVGLFVLILACINFMNLSTARAEARAKEVGIRKTIGSARKQLVSQFFTESFIVVILSFLFAVLLVGASLEGFNTLAGKRMTMPLDSIDFWIISVGFIISTSILAGSYPAFYLSSFQPVKVLKGVFRSGRMAAVPRKVLVVVQFTISVTLIIGTVIVYQQIQYAKNRPVGYDRKGLLMVPLNSAHAGKLETLKTALIQTGVVENVAESQSPVTAIWSTNGGFNWRGMDPDLQAEFATLGITHTYGATVGWQLVKGRDFSEDLASDSAGMILNEAAARVMGFENPINEIVASVWRPGGNFKVIGVIKDMVMRSPFDPVMPTVFFIDRNLNWMNIKMATGVSTPDALAAIEKVCSQLAPSIPFDYKFADTEYAMKFVAEERIGKLASLFASLAIFISCLGLFGLASFVAAQRTKEIGIRKIVGASVFSLWKMLSKDFVILVVASSFIAIPVAWYVVSRWLLDYSYRIQVSWEVFALSTGGAIGITLLTVSYQAVRAALMNPARSLRTE